MMPSVSITRIHDQEKASSALFALTEQKLQDIRRRAFEYFRERGQYMGNDWDDWLRAERELLWRPDAEMLEHPSAIVLRVAVPGFDARSIQVTAAPHSLVVQSTETHHHEGIEARLRFCEFGQCLFRRFDLPARIAPSTVSATLDKGILEIIANIARQPREIPDAETAVPASGEVNEACMATN